MQIIGNTYVGGNPAQQQLSQSGENAANRIAQSFALKRQQQATANENIRAEEERRAKAAFLSLDEQVKALRDKFGSDVFEPGHAGYEDAQKLLLGTGSAYARAFGGDPAAYISAYSKNPATEKQLIAWDISQGNLKGNNQPTKGAGDAYYAQDLVGQQVSYQGGGKSAAGAGDFIPVVDTRPAPPVPAPPVGPQGISPGHPAALYPAEKTALVGLHSYPADKIDTEGMIAKVRDEQRADDEKKKRLAEEKRQAGLREKVGQRLGISPAQVLQAEMIVRSDASAVDSMVRDIQKDPAEAKKLYEFALKSLEDPALQMGEQHLRMKALYEAAQEKLSPATSAVRLPPAYDAEGANRIPAAGTLPVNRARGTGRPQMTPTQLARHEAATGDYHYPALIGVKEGVVNARAMENGGDEVVRMLNKGYPVFVEGKDNETGGGISAIDAIAARDPGAARQATMAQYEAAQASRAGLIAAESGQNAVDPQAQPSQDMGYETGSNDYDPRYDTPAGGPTTAPQAYAPAAPAGDKASLVDMIGSMVSGGAKATRKGVSSASKAVTAAVPRIAALVGQKAEAIALGNMPKAKAVTTRLLDEERKAIVAHLSDPSYREHNDKVREGLRQFMETADDVQLAYYGFDNVLKAKQDARKFEEEVAVNKATSNYHNELAANQKKSIGLVEAQIRLLNSQISKTEAEESLALARAKAIDENPSIFNMSESAEEIRKWAGVYKTPEELNTFIMSNPTVKKAFDNYSVAITGNPSATWTNSAKQSWWGKIVSRFTSGSAPTVAAPQGTGMSTEATDFLTKNNLLE